MTTSEELKDRLSHAGSDAALAEAEKQLAIVGAMEETATRLSHTAAAGWCLAALLFFLPHWWAYVITVVAYFVVFFLLKTPYDRAYDKASDAYRSLHRLRF
jgi:hypothetical protein